MLTRESVIAAEVLIEDEGDRALLIAAYRVRELRLIGDDRGAQLWENVAEALLTSRIKRPKGAASIH